MEQPLRRPAVVATVAAALVLLGVVGLAARPESALGLAPAAPAELRRVLVDTLFYLSLVTVVLFLLLCVWALWPDPDSPPLPRPQRRSWLWLLVPLLTAFTAALVISRLRLAGLGGRLPVPGGAGGGNGLGPLAGGGGAAGVDWIAAGLVLGFLAGAGLLLWLRLRPRPAPAGRRRLPARALEEIFDDALDAVLAEADPRRAVIAAYARMESVLAAYGQPRRDSEAPFEYVSRALAALGLPALILRLAELYEWARFSPHEVGAGMREEALAGLLAIRDALRETREELLAV